MGDLVERLKAESVACRSAFGEDIIDLHAQAADEIERLRAELVEMTEEAQDGWGYADDHFQHKWLSPERLAAWFHNRYLTDQEKK
jgi:hypothetical protein